MRPLNPNNPALEAALQHLKPRERFTAELRSHLVDKQFATQDIEEAIQILLERKLVSDERATEAFLRRRSGKQAVGADRLRAELEAAGAGEAALGALPPEEDRALELLRMKYPKGSDRAKAGRFLYGRGFEESAIDSALDAFCT